MVYGNGTQSNTPKTDEDDYYPVVLFHAEDTVENGLCPVVN